MQNKSTLPILIFLLLILLSGASNYIYASDDDTTKKSFDPRIEIKLNSILLIGIINPAIEFKVHKKGTVQLEVLGIFYPKGFLGRNNPPLTLVGSWLDFRYYLTKAFDGIYIGANGGFASYRMCKNKIYWEQRKIQVGAAMMFGATFGYKLNLSDRWVVDFYWSPGWQNSVYEGYNVDTGERYVGINESGEWLLAYKGGISIAFRL